MTLSIPCRIMGALAALLEGIPGVDTVVLDEARVADPPAGVAITLDAEGPITDEIGRTCQVDSTLPVLLTITMPRAPGGPPNWEILDPIYTELHRRVMADRRLGGLALDIRSVSRTPEPPDIRICALACRYAVAYRTRQEDVTLQ
jgi:hypothetical protein